MIGAASSSMNPRIGAWRTTATVCNSRSPHAVERALDVLERAGHDDLARSRPLNDHLGFLIRAGRDDPRQHGGEDDDREDDEGRVGRFEPGELHRGKGRRGEALGGGSGFTIAGCKQLRHGPSALRCIAEPVGSPASRALMGRSSLAFACTL